MAAQGLPSGFCSNSPLNPSQNPKTPFFTALPFSFSLSSKRVSLKTHNFFVSQIVSSSKKIFMCRSSIERAEISGSDVTGGSEKGIRRKNLAVFVSGGGSNFRAIHKAILGGSVHGDIVVLVTNKLGCGGAEYARSKGIPVILYPRTKSEAQGLSSDDLVAALRRYKVDFILLAGYLKLLPSVLVRAYPKSILNIHPSLLPSFGGKGYYGLKVHKAVIASGAS